MKTISIILGLVVLSCTLFSCEHERIKADKEVTIVDVDFSGYTGLDLSDAFNAYITFSDSEEKIQIEANKNIHDKIRVTKEGNILKIKLKNHTNIRGKVTLNVYITTKNITHFNASGASDIILENKLTAQNVKLDLSGAAEFSGELSVNRLELDSSGASDIDIYGNADQFDANLSGSSTLKNYDLVVGQLDITLSGASDAFLSVTERIDIDASGASTLKYKGNAVIGNKNLSGASEIIKKD